MSKGLMERDEWYKLGLGDVEDAASAKARVPSQSTIRKEQQYCRVCWDKHTYLEHLID